MYVENKSFKKKLQESDEKGLKQKRDEKEYNVNRKSTVVLYIKEKPLHGPRIRKALYTEKEQTQIYLLENLYMTQESEVLNI